MKYPDIRVSAAALVLGIAVAAAGCGGAQHDLHNTGRACLYPSGQGSGNPLLFPDMSAKDYPADGPLDVTVLVDCLSSTCTVQGSQSASCTVEVDGETLRVDARGSYRDTGDDACSSDCQALVAHCTTPAPVTAGSWTFAYVTKSAAIAIPSSVPPRCLASDLPVN